MKAPRYGTTDLLEVMDVASPPSVQAETQHLDEGEREAIQLAVDEELPLLIEKQAGRQAVLELGLHISGNAGQLRKGFQEGT